MSRTIHDQLPQVVKDIELQPADPNYRINELIRQVEQAELPSAELKLAILELDEFLKPAPAPDQHRYEPRQPRFGRLRGGGKPFLVLDSQNVAMKATLPPNEPDGYPRRQGLTYSNRLDAEHARDLGAGRKIADLSRIPAHRRRFIANVLSTRLAGSTRQESPVIVPRGTSQHQTIKNKTDQISELLSEIRGLVEKLKLPESQHFEVLRAASELGKMAGREAALDLIREIGCLQYTCIWDETERRICRRFPNAGEAAAFVHGLLELPASKCQILNGFGKPIGRYRFRTCKPDYQGEINLT